MSNFDNNFLGVGWAFPPAFSINSRGVDLLSDEEDIKNSLEILLSTRIGERIMQPNYGCNLDPLLFEPLTLTLQTLIKDTVFKAVYFFEPRVKPLQLLFSAQQEQGTIFLELQYEVVATNTRYNLVYPYYLTESKVPV